MYTSNAVYGSGFLPLSAPPPGEKDIPTVVPHFTQTAYPYKPKPKSQLFNCAVLPSGQRIVFEKDSPMNKLAQSTSNLSTTTKSYAGVLPKSRLDAAILSSAATRVVTSPSTSSTRDASLSASSFAPDLGVLRFYAYWHEGVPDSAEERDRFRKVVICYFVVDGTIDVNEPREDNSGLIQGPVLRRHRIPKYPESVPGIRRPDNVEADDVYDWTDLLVGDEVNFYGRVYHIYDADKCTRSWFAARDIPLAEAEEMPTDPVAIKLAKAKVSGGKTDKGHNRVMFPAKLYAEARLGKFIRDPEARRKFQEHDGKVLKFDCVWDNSGSDYGDSHHLLMEYYLSDDQAEVKFVHANNDGYPSTISLLRKGALPKDWNAARDTTPDERPELYLRPSDLVIGKTIDVYGRKLLIRAADPWTREWYNSTEAKSEYGCSPQPANMTYSAPVVEKPKFVIPPHTGFGSEEDSVQSCYTFNVKPLKSDYVKWALNDGIVHRFHARIETNNPVDKMRRFTIACYPSDDSLSVYEPPVKNSGHKGGVFLKRSRYRKADGKPYVAEDFKLGTTVAVFSHKFTILDADRDTKERLPHMFEGAEATKLSVSHPAYNPHSDAQQYSFQTEDESPSSERLKHSVRFQV